MSQRNDDDPVAEEAEDVITAVNSGPPDADVPVNEEGPQDADDPAAEEAEEITTAVNSGSPDADTPVDGGAQDATSTVTFTATSTPTLLFNLAGSLCFCAGSIGFIWSTWTIEWLRPLQYGCTLWIMGSILFLIPLLAFLQTRCCHRDTNASSRTCASSCWSRSEISLIGCLLCFVVGCAFGTVFSTEESVVGLLPPMNGLFLAGSTLLFVDTLVVFIGSLRTLTCTSLRKLVAFCQDDDNSPHGCIGVVVAASYVFASALGGYGHSQGVIRAGMFGWIVGSVVSLLETIPELYKRCMDSSRGCCYKSYASPRKPVSTGKKPESASVTSSV